MTFPTMKRTKLSRYVVLAALALLSVVSPAVPAAAASGPLKIIVGFSPGSGLDLIARLVGKKIQDNTGRTVVVENRPGAGSRIAAEAVARSPADGSVVLIAPIVTTAFTPFIDKKLGYDALADLAPITRVGNFKFTVAVGKDFPANNLAEFVAYVKAHPGTVSFGSPGAGTPAHFLGVMLNRATGMDMLHVPYKGSGPAATALLAGEIQVSINTTASMKEFYNADQMKFFAVTGTERSPTLPKVPTFGELKMNLGDIESAELWYGMLAPGKTPPDVVDELNREIIKTLNDPEVRKTLANIDIDVAYDTPAEFVSRVKADYDRWGKVIRTSGFTLND
jgi:tripartite-type tricarboxylate transporter receptor subunit TctC